MPPYMDTPNEVAALIVGILGGLVAVTVGVIGAAGAVLVAWRSKLRPLLVDTKRAAQVAAHQLQNNSGSSTKDAVDRIEGQLTELARDVRYLRGDMRAAQTANDDVHRDLAGRLRSLESPYERNPQ